MPAIASPLGQPAYGPTRRPRAIAVLSVHASPLGELGRGENGGMNLAIRRLCEELSARGVPSDVFVRREDPEAPSEQLIAPGSRLVLLEAGPPQPLPKTELLALLPRFTAALLAHAASESRAYRLVHSHYWLSGFVAARATQRWRVPWVHSAHTLARLKAQVGLPLDEERAAIERVVVRGADRLVAASQSEAAALTDLYAVGPDDICVVPPGVDADLFTPRPTAALRDRYGTAGRRTVLYAGRLERLKGIDLLLDALADLRRRPGFADVLLLCAGADSGDGEREAGHPAGERGRLAARARELGLAASVRFLGPVPREELAALDALADVVAVPSLTETFGLVALEAQAAGTPVVASAVGGLVEIVRDGVGGLLVEGRDPVRFADALAVILGDPLTRARLGEGGRRHAQTFTWTRAADRLLALYDCVELADVRLPAEACACV
ncbi:MAG TPA: glycosyltransferase [Candidatus Dormibacteraeota bacterium]